MSVYRRFVSYCVAIGATAIALFLSVWLHTVIDRPSAAFFYLAVAISTWYGGMRPGLVTLILSVLALAYFFIPPIYSIQISNFHEVIWLVSFVAVALIINLVSVNLQESKRNIEQLNRKLAEESANRLKVALNAAHMGLWDWNIMTGEITWSPEHEQLFGLPPGTFDGNYATFDACLHPDDREGLNQVVDYSLQTQLPFHHEYRVVWRDGSVHWIEGRGQAFYNKDRQPVRMSGTSMGIDARKHSEVALQRSEEQLRLAFAFAQIGHWDWDLPTNEITWNSVHFHLLGLDPETTAASYENWRDRVHPDDVVQIEAAIQEALQTHTSYVAEYRIIRPDGSLCWMFGKGQAIYDASGQAIRMLGVLLDITDRKQAEAQLQEREAILRLFAQYAPAGIAMFDRDMRYVTASQRWADDYYYGSLESMIGRWHYDLFPEMSERWKQIHQRCLAGAIEKSDEDLFVRADGRQQWTRWEVRPWYTATDQIGGIIIFAEDITQRKQAEASVLQLNRELQQRVNELQTLLDVIPIGIGIANDPECQDIRVNPAFAETLGIPSTVNASLSAPEAERPTSFKVYQNGQEVAPEALPLQVAAKHGVEIRDVEFEVIWQDGTVVTLLEYASPLLDEYGQTRGSVGAFINITERKRAEADLQKYKDIFQFAEYGLAISKGSRLEFVNPAFAQMHGYPVEEMVDKPILELFPSECYTATIAFIQQLDQVGHLSYESYHLRKDGTVFPILLDITVVKDEQDNLLYRIVTAFDITERKRAEQALRESEERYRILVQNFPNGAVFLFNHDLRYLLAGGQGLAEVGLDRNFLEGKTIWEALDAATCRAIEPYYREALAGNSHVVDLPFADRIYRTYFLPLYDDQDRVKLGMLMTHDITLQKQAEHTLRTARNELERQVQARTWELQQMTEELQRSNQELEQFAYVASHDLQEPLRTITSFTQLLAKRYQGKLDAKADTYIEFVVDGAIRMQQLVRDLLTYSRTGRYELSMQSIDCNGVLERVKKDLQVAIAENQAVITSDPLPTITADLNQFTNLLQNLINNSLKYRSEANPHIHIAAKIITTEINHSTGQNSPLSIPPSEQAWLFSIQDNGIGLEPQYAERIFGIFQRLHTSDEYSGTGLGLAICKKIVERHAGRIWVESQLGQGATFFFTIPIPTIEDFR